LIGKQSYNIDHRIVYPDGEVRLIHGEATVMFNKVGTPIFMLGTVQDITVLNQAKQSLDVAAA
jgi:PAS domain-containing protein